MVLSPFEVDKYPWSGQKGEREGGSGRGQVGVGGGGQRDGGGLDVYDKGSHFLVSHFLGWRAAGGEGDDAADD